MSGQLACFGQQKKSIFAWGMKKLSTISDMTSAAPNREGPGVITLFFQGAGLKTMGLIRTTADRGSGIAALVICIIAFSGLFSPHGLVDLDAVNQSYSAQTDYHFLLCIRGPADVKHVSRGQKTAFDYYCGLCF